MKKSLLTLLLGFLTIGVLFPNLYGDTLSALIHGIKFGSITYPTSLDNFENPGATQSVATVVTHSTHHANANDAIEAIQAKLGIGASTPVANTLLSSNGTGISGWFTWATTTRMTSDNFLATGSSTFQNFTFVNATGTAATTTSFYSTTASTTNFAIGGGTLSIFGTSGTALSSFCSAITGGSGLCDGTDSTGSASFVSTSTATTTTTASGYNFKQTVSLTAGQTIVVWATLVGNISIDSAYCNNREYGLFIKPTSLATSTISLARCDVAANNQEMSIPFSGLYVAKTTESHEIYMGVFGANEYYGGATGYSSILYQIVNP